MEVLIGTVFPTNIRNFCIFLVFINRKLHFTIFEVYLRGPPRCIKHIPIAPTIGPMHPVIFSIERKVKDRWIVFRNRRFTGGD